MKGLHIALIGAPGAGKSEVAKLVATRWPKVLAAVKEPGLDKLSPWSFNSAVSILDDYTNLPESIGLDVGETSDWKTSMAMHFEHMKQRSEFDLLDERSPQIDCGTSVERLAHGAARIMMLQAGLVPENSDTQARIMQDQAMLPPFTQLLYEGWRYEYAFYLPLASSKIITPATSVTSFAVKVDLAIQDLMQSFNIGLQMLEGTVEQKADAIIETLVRLEPKRIKDLQEAVTDEPAVAD